MLLTYKGLVPQLAETVYLAPTACVIGDVVVGDDSSLWFNVVVRGDVNSIRIGARSNIQDNSVIHVTRDTHPTFIGDDVTIGHSVVLHGCTVESGSLVGIGAKVLDGAVVGESSLIAAGSLVVPGMKIPPRSLVMGHPAKVVRTLSDNECIENSAIAERYIDYQYVYRTEVERIS